MLRETQSGIAKSQDKNVSGQGGLSQDENLAKKLPHSKGNTFRAFAFLVPFLMFLYALYQFWQIDIPYGFQDSWRRLKGTF